MAWYYEILGKNDMLLEQSKPIYKTKWEAQWAGYRHFKDNQVIEGDLRRVPELGNIRTKQKND